MKNIKSYQQEFKEYLIHYSRSLDYFKPKELYKPFQYILNTDAKYIRPVLCMLSCELYGHKKTKALNAALAIELFHTFSLVHDDILDNSPLRRGKKTIHQKWNTNIAILVGDSMLIKSYQLLTKYPPETAHSLLKTLTDASVRICEGQQEDMNFEKRKRVTVTEYLEMIRKKTSVLIGTSLKMGAIIANAPKQQQAILYKIGENIGIAFQIMDDYLDTFGDSKVLGKKIGNDILTNKKTYLLTKAIEIATTRQKQEINTIINLPTSQDKIDRMTNIYRELGVDALALNTVKNINRKNHTLIEQLKHRNDRTKRILIELSENLTQRVK